MLEQFSPKMTCVNYDHFGLHSIKLSGISVANTERA